MYRSLALAHGRSCLLSLCKRAGCRSNPSPSTSRHHPEPAPPTAVHVGGRGLVYVREAIFPLLVSSLDRLFPLLAAP